MLWVCLSVALLSRMWGVGHGYPDFVSGDERVIVKEGVKMLFQGTLEPGHYNYPAFYSYLLAGAVWVAYALGWLLDVGGAGYSAGFAHLFYPGQLALIGRLVNVLAGVGLVLVTFFLGRKAFGERVGVGGAVFAGVSMVLVSRARLALPDVTMALLAVWACIPIVDVLRGGKQKDYLLAGLLCGLAISTKYNAGMVLGGLLVAHGLRADRRGIGTFGREIFASLGAVAVGFIIGSPYWVIDPDTYLQALRAVGSNLQFSLIGAEWPRLSLLMSVWKVEMVWGGLCTAGCLFGLWRRTRVDLVLLAIVIPAFLYIGSWPKGGIHYAIFLLPLTGILAARVVVELLPVERSWLLPAVWLLISIPQLWDIYHDGVELSRADLRSVAARWIEANIPDGSVLGVYRVEYCPPVKGDIHRNFLRERIRANRDRKELVERLTDMERRIPIYVQMSLEYFMEQPAVPEAYRNTVDLSDPKTLETFSRTWMEYGELRHWKVRYLVLPSAGYRRFFESEPPPAGTPEHYYFTRNRAYLKQFFDPDDRRYRKIEEFAVPSGEGNENRITILEVL